MLQLVLVVHMSSLEVTTTEHRSHFLHVLLCERLNDKLVSHFHKLAVMTVLHCTVPSALTTISNVMRMSCVLILN